MIEVDGMNPKRERFCQEYVVDCNASQAAQRTGYGRSPASAASHGTRLLTVPAVAERIDELQAEVATRLQLNAHYVLTGLKEVHERCTQKVAVTNEDGEITGWTFNASGANRALELIGKHLKLFTDKVEHGSDISMAAMISAMRKSREQPSDSRN